MSPLRVFAYLWILGGLVFAIGVIIMLAAVAISWLWKRP